MLDLLAVFGLWFLSTQSELTVKIRRWIIGLHPILFKLFDCSFCLSFHLGWIYFFLLKMSLVSISSIKEMIIFAFAAASFNWIVVQSLFKN